MRQKTKILWLCLSLCLLFFGLVSCKPNSNKSEIDDNVIYSDDVKTTLVLGEGVEESDVSDIRTAYYRRLGKEISISKSSASAVSHEIIIGKAERSLSDKAYRYLAGFKSEDNYVGYVIYSDGKSVAIAFDDAVFGEAVAFSEAIERFVQKYMQADSLKLSEGVACYEYFEPFEKQQARDEEAVNRMWELKLSQIMSKTDDKEKAEAVLTELKSLHHIYNDNYSIVKWLANLYDPETGGFYYSNSARNNQGYLPDLESTSQALGIIEAILIGYGGTLTDYLGEDIAAKFVSFTKNMQSSNGYFYHPQWADLTVQNLNRRDRDVLAALNILEYFGASPIYDTPNGVKGEGVIAPASALATPFVKSRMAAVSTLVASSQDEIYIPPHLKSKEAFENYLSGLNIRLNTLSVCEQIISEIPLYNAVDEKLEQQGALWRICDILEKYLSRNQNQNTGMWSYENNVTIEDVEAIIGVSKIFNGIGKVMPGFGVIFNTISDFVAFKDTPDDISDISVVWAALASAVSNLTAFGNEYEAAFYLSDLYMNFDAVIKNTKENLLRFLRKDGSFSTTPTGSASEVFDMPMSVPLMEEGDMNATLLAVNTVWLSVFRVLDIGSVPIFTTSDRMMFEKTLLDMGVIIKNEVRKTQAINFENQEVGDSAGVTVDMAAKFGTKAEVVETGGEHGKVLRLYSPPDGKSTSDKFYFDVMSSVKNASCLSFEVDICVNDFEYVVEGTNFAYLMIANDAYAIALNRKDNEIRFFEETSAKEADYSYSQDLGIRATVGEWFTLRVEYYIGTAKTVRIKIYFGNGSAEPECIAVTDNFYDYYAAKDSGTGLPKTDCRGFAVYGLWGRETDILVDNILVEKSYKSYTVESSDRFNKNIDASDNAQTVYDFDSSSVGSLPSGFTSSGTAGAAVVTTDENNNRLLSISERAGEVILPLQQMGTEINSALIEFEFTVSPESAAGAKYQINFNEYLYKDRSFGAIQLLVLEDSGGKYVSFADVSSKQTGTIYSNAKLLLGEKHRISIRIFFEEEVMAISLITDEETRIIGMSSSVLAKAKRYYMGETTIEALTPAVSSSLLIDNLVSARLESDFEEITAADEERKTYTFDDTADMELTDGFSPIGGALSFNTNGESAVTIPVNTRVNAPTMAFVSFDVNVVSSSGNLVITLGEDKEKIIAKFGLGIENSSVEIYEHTKKGQYTAPLHTVNKTKFNLTIEYSAEKESFNLLVDGEYVAASSLIYTSESAAYDFKYLCISSSGACGLSIDNLYAEESYGIFKAQKVSMENTDSTAEVITYETSSFASLPTNITRDVGSTSYFRVKAGYILRSGDKNEVVSKVLEFYTAGGSIDYITFKRTSTSSAPDTNAVYFETDMMLSLTGIEKWVNAELCFQSNVSGTPSQYVFRIIANANQKGEKLQITGANESDFKETVSVKEGEWFRLRLEYCGANCDFNYDNVNECIFRAYINGTFVGEGHTSPYPENIQPYNTVDKLRLALYGTSEGKIYLDNTSFGQFTMKYEEPAKPDTDTITNSTGAVTYKTEFTLGTKSSTASVVEMNEMSGEVGKVLKFHSAKNSADKLEIGVTQTLEGATGITFETDIMFSPDSGTQTFYLEPMTKDNTQPFRLVIKAKSGGAVTVSATGLSEKEIGRCGEWIHLKVDYMTPNIDYTGDGFADILYKVYVGEGDAAVLKATGYYTYGSSQTDPLTLKKYVFTSGAASGADIYFDNIRFWQVKLEADEAPKFEESEGGDSYIGSPSIDFGGWG